MTKLNEFIMERPAFLKREEVGPGLQQDNKPQFEIHTLEWMEQHRPFYDGVPKKIACYEIIWVKKGQGSLAVDLQEYSLEDDSIYCLAPGQLRVLNPVSNLQGYYISLSAEFLYVADSQLNFSFLNRHYTGSKSLPVIQPDKEMQSEIEMIVQKMMKEMANYFVLRTEILKGLLKVFMIYLFRKFEVKEMVQDNDTELVRKFIVLIKKHFTTLKMVADYAKELCVTPNYLNKLVKQMTGFPASHHIQQQIILEAKRQAIYSGLSMKEVSYLLGFDNYAHFSKFFKNNTGMNFTSFKNGVH